MGRQTMDYSALTSIRQALAGGDEEPLRVLVHTMRSADLADVIEHLDAEERAGVLALLDDDALGGMLQEVDEPVAASIVRDLPPARASRVLGEMPHDDAADVLQDIPHEEATALLAGMDAGHAQDVRELLGYPETTAGGRMITGFVTVSESARVAEVIAGLRADPPSGETAYYLYAQDESGRLAGVISLRDLIVARPDVRVGDIMPRDVVSVRADADQEEAAELVARYDLLALPVVDVDDRVVGVITVDDILEVLEEEATEEILRLSSGAEPRADEPAGPAFRARLPGAVAALVSGLVAAAVMAAFRGSLGFHAALLLFLPLALAVSEVVTAQVMAAIAGAIRREVPPARLRRAVAREMIITVVLSGLAGVLVTVVLGHWRGLGPTGALLGTAIVLSATIAALAGITAPILSRWVRHDPSAIPVSLVAAFADTVVLVAFVWLLRAW